MTSNKKISDKMIAIEKAIRDNIRKGALRDWHRQQLGKAERTAAPMFRAKNERGEIIDSRVVGHSVYSGYTDQEAIAAVSNYENLQLAVQHLLIGKDINSLGSIVSIKFGAPQTVHPMIYIHSASQTNTTEQAIGIDAKGNYVIGINRNTNNKVSSWAMTAARASIQQGYIRGAGFPNYLQSPVVVSVDSNSNYAYVAAYGNSAEAYGDNALVVINIQDKENPTFVSKVSYDGDASGVNLIDGISSTFVLDNYCYVTGFYDNSFLIYDVSDPTNPTLAGGVRGSTAGSTPQQYYDGSSWTSFSGTNYLWGASASWVYKSGSNIYAAVASRKDGSLAIYDVTEPASIQLKSVKHHKELGGTDAYELAGAISVQVEYHSTDAKWYAYVGTRWQGYYGGDGYGVNETNGWDNEWKTGNRTGSVTIFDVTDPTSPVHKGEVHGKYNADTTKPLSEVHWIQYVKDTGSYSHEYVYAACFGDNAMAVIDVSDKTNPTVVNYLRGSGSPNYLDGAVGLHVKKNTAGDAKYCYVACFGDNGFVILDVENVTSTNAPTRIGGRAGTSVAGDPYWLEDSHSVHVDDDNYLYIVSRGNANSFNIFAVENSVNFPSTATNTLTHADIDTPNRIKVFGDYGYIASYATDKLVIINLTNPASMSFVASFGGAGSPNYLDGITSVDVCNSAADSKDIAVCTAYGDNSLVAVDVTTKSSPSLLSAKTGSGSGAYLGGAFGCAIIKSGNDLDKVAVAAYSDNALAIYQWSSGALSFLNAVSGSGDPNYLGGARAVAVYGNYAFVVAKTDNALTIWNLTNVSASEAPVKVKTFSGTGSPNYMGGASDVTIDNAGEYAYVASRDDDAIVQVNISDPTSAYVSGVIQGVSNYLDGALRVACATIHGDEYILVASWDSGRFVVLKKSDFEQNNIVGLRNYYGQMQKRDAYGAWTAI